MELKVWVEGILRVISGVDELTTCQVKKISNHMNKSKLIIIFYLYFCKILHKGRCIRTCSCNWQNWTFCVDRTMEDEHKVEFFKYFR